MKNILIIGALFFSLSACHTSGTKKVDNKTLTEDANMPNVNGNIPDTTNSINVNPNMKNPVRTGKDSLK